MTIPDEIRARIVGMSEGGMSGARIARIIGESSRTVQRIIKQFREHETYQANSSTGRPKKLSERDVRQILLFSKTHRRSSLQDITNACPVDVSTRTVRRVLHDHNIFSRIAVKKPFLKPLHISRRLHFARQYCGWSAEEWERVCWTDESSFEIGKDSRQIHVWRTAYERYSSSCVVPTFKSGRTSLMIWGGFGGDKKSELVFMPKDRRKAIDFVELVYDGHLLQFMGQVSRAILMEDGAPVHRSKAPEEWRKSHLIEKLEWPANSPDLNSLENVWKLLKNAVQHGQSIPKSLDELKATIQREWTLVSSSQLLTLCHSMPARLQSVIEARGGHTHW